MNKNHFLLGLVFLILAQTMVGVNIVSSKLLLTSIPVLVLLDIRFILASFILFSLHWTTPARHESMLMPFLKLNLRDWGFIIAQALSAGVLFNCLMLTGLNYTDANVAGIITSALPAIIAIMSWLMLGEKISSQKALCVVFATLGLIMIAYDKYDGIGKSHSFFGDVIVLLSLLPEAGYYILFKLYPNKLPMFLVSALLNAINALILLTALFFIDWTPSAIQLVDFIDTRLEFRLVLCILVHRLTTRRWHHGVAIYCDDASSNRDSCLAYFKRTADAHGVYRHERCDFIDCFIRKTLILRLTIAYNFNFHLLCNHIHCSGCCKIMRSRAWL